MGTPRQISHKQIREFLQQTYPDLELEWRETANSIYVPFPSRPDKEPGYLPKGPSNSRNASVPIGYFKHLARYFGVDAEAKAWIKAGRKSPRDADAGCDDTQEK